ncbi:MAG TPA: ATP-binding protein [Longimicrobiales bacterium]
MTEATVRELEAVSTFAAIARTLTESLELPEVLRRIASEVLAMTGSQGVSIIMPRGELGEFVAHESPPPHSRIPVGFRFRPDPGMLGMLAGRREPLVILDLHASPLIPDEIKARIDARDLIVVPLRVDAELVGALIIAYNELPEQMPWDPALLRAVGDQAAVAIRNAQLYEAARTAGEQLVQAEQLSAMGRVVARIAHQLNNPLTTARLLAESLALEPLPPSGVEQVRALGREIERAAAVVRDLLIFARKGRREFAPVRIADVVHGAIAGEERRLAVSGVTAELHVEEGLPAVQGDARALHQVLANLLHNAVQALAEREQERRITVRARRAAGPDGPEVVIEVEDNGPGIPPEVRGRLFEPFFTTKPVGEGTGLGLPIAKEIVEVHGGSLDVVDATSGAAFRIRLPAMAGEAPAPPDDAAAPVADASLPLADAVPAAARTLRVLVIDDEVELQRALRRVLERLGCEVTVALDGDRGFALAAAGGFDLILSDIRVPGMSGREMYERLRAEAPAAAEAVTFMTGDSVTEEIRAFLSEVGRPVLAKPFGLAQLQSLLHGARSGTA